MLLKLNTESGNTSCVGKENPYFVSTGSYTWGAALIKLRGSSAVLKAISFS